MKTLYAKNSASIHFVLFVIHFIDLHNVFIYLNLALFIPFCSVIFNGNHIAFLKNNYKHKPYLFMTCFKTFYFEIVSHLKENLQNLVEGILHIVYLDSPNVSILYWFCFFFSLFICIQTYAYTYTCKIFSELF